MIDFELTIFVLFGICFITLAFLCTFNYIILLEIW